MAKNSIEKLPEYQQQKINAAKQAAIATSGGSAGSASSAGFGGSGGSADSASSAGVGGGKSKKNNNNKNNKNNKNGNAPVDATSADNLPYTVLGYTPEMYTPATAPDIPEFNAPKWSNDYLNNIDTSYYTNAVNRYKAYAEQNRANQLGEAEKAQKTALTQAYVTRLQNERRMAENMAMAGIRGGATETAMLNLANQYGQARASANTDYTNSVNAINQSIDSNIFDYQSDMDARAEEYRQNMGQAQWQADREGYGNQYQANLDRLWNIYNAQNDANMYNVEARNAANQSLVEAQNNAYINQFNAKREDKQNRNANAEFGTVNYYTNKYSTKSKENLKELEKKLENKKDKLEKGGVKKKEKDEYKRIKNKLAGVAAARANKTK